jgi:hypothetical protein
MTVVYGVIRMLVLVRAESFGVSSKVRASGILLEEKGKFVPAMDLHATNKLWVFRVVPVMMLVRAPVKDV